MRHTMIRIPRNLEGFPDDCRRFIVQGIVLKGPDNQRGIESTKFDDTGRRICRLSGWRAILSVIATGLLSFATRSKSRHFLLPEAVQDKDGVRQ